MADFLDHVIKHLRESHKELSAQDLLRLEVNVRQDWGGSETGYCAKRPALQRQLKIGESLQQHKPLADVFMDAGAKRAWGFRLMARKQKSTFSP